MGCSNIPDGGFFQVPVVQLYANPPDNVSPQVELDRNVWVLMGWIDASADNELYDIGFQ